MTNTLAGRQPVYLMPNATHGYKYVGIYVAKDGQLRYNAKPIINASRRSPRLYSRKIFDCPHKAAAYVNTFFKSNGRPAPNNILSNV